MARCTHKQLEEQQRVDDDDEFAVLTCFFFSFISICKAQHSQHRQRCSKKIFSLSLSLLENKKGPG